MRCSSLLLHVDLGPVVRRLAEHLGLDAIRIINGYGPSDDWGADGMRMARNQEFPGTDLIRAAAHRAPLQSGAVPLRTVDYSSPLLALVP